MKSFAKADSLPKSLSTPTKNEVCIERPIIESYKNRCELAQAKLKETDAALQDALSDPKGLSFYQEKPFVAGHAALTLILLGLLVSGASK